MLFNSHTFLFAFLPVVLAVWLRIRRAANPVWPLAWLVAASLFYYGWWQPRFLLLLLFSIGINLGFGKIIIKNGERTAKAKIFLVIGVVFNLSLLAYFKYAGFVVENINSLTGAGWHVPQIILPIGISFITFQKIAFLVDAYRGEVKNFTLLNYFLFVTFFPQLIAGPIVHHAEIMPQLGNKSHRDVRSDIAVGISIFIVGLFKKVIIADTLAVYADAGFGAIKAGGSLDCASAWIAALSYSLQLYYDFSGYSEMALGLGRMFGIVLPVNFFSPYKASSIIEFWRYWHMTLSRFLKDYLYIPLGGSRHGSLRRHFNLMLTMLVGGLWHGANWTFVLWGGLHGLMLSINHAWRSCPLSMRPFFHGKMTHVGFVILTFTLVTLTWVFFRSESVAEASRMLSSMFPFDGSALDSLNEMRRAQFSRVLRGNGIGDWFVAKELWPQFIPHDYLAVKAKPAGLVLALILFVTFKVPNTLQFFAKFDPASGVPKERASESGGLYSVVALDNKVAWVLSAMLVLSVISLARLSPFLYFQF